MSCRCLKALNHVDTPSRRLPGPVPGLLLLDSGNRYVNGDQAPPRPKPPLIDHSLKASGLYYLSELVEEHTVFSKRLLNQLIYAVVGLQLLLCIFDGFPFLLSALSVGSHVIYAQNLRRFPIVKLTDPIFLLSCCKKSPLPPKIHFSDDSNPGEPGLVLLNHYLWFVHFSAPPRQRYKQNYYGVRDPSMPSFTEIASYFGLCVWLVPFALFVSLSAGEYVLPSMGSEYATGEGSSFISPGKSMGSPAIGGPSGSSLDGGRRRRARAGTNSGMAKAMVNGVRDWVGETGEVMGFWKGDRTRPL